MRWYKISALLWQDLRIIRRTKFRFVELVYLPILTTLIWGFFTLFAREFAAETGIILLVVNIFWSFSYGVQSSVNQSMNMDVWSESLKQLFASGISKFEYLAARVLSSLVSEVCVLAVLLGISAVAFGITAIWGNLALLALLGGSVVLASLGLSFLVAALHFRLGRQYGFLAWTANTLFIFFSAPYFPVSTFPPVLQAVAQVMPYTSVFEAIRLGFSSGAAWDAAVRALAVGACYFVALIPLYSLSFERARRVGALARMG